MNLSVALQCLHIYITSVFSGSLSFREGKIDQNGISYKLSENIILNKHIFLIIIIRKTKKTLTCSIGLLRIGPSVQFS